MGPGSLGDGAERDRSISAAREARNSSPGVSPCAAEDASTNKATRRTRAEINSFSLPPNGSRLSCGRACTTVASTPPAGGTLCLLPTRHEAGGRRLTARHATDRGCQLQPLVRRRRAATGTDQAELSAVKQPEVRVRAVGQHPLWNDRVRDSGRPRTAALQQEPEEQGDRARKLRERIAAPPNGSRLSCGRARTTLPPTGRRRRSHPGPDGGRPRPPHTAVRGRQLQPLVRRRRA